MTDNLPVPDDLPHLNLSQSEIYELRKNKNYLTEYGKKKLRKMNQQAREQAMKTAMEFIHKYDGDLKALAATEKEELKQELEALKKQNFQKVADCCMDEYKETYGKLPSEDEYFRYMICDEYSTGCGRTLSVLMYAALPEKDDCDENYNPINSKEFRCVRQFHRHFGTYSLYGLQFVSREDFFGKYGHLLPPALIELKDKSCYLNYHSELHFNFS